MNPGLRRGIVVGLIAELPGVAAVVAFWPALTTAGPLIALPAGLALMIAGSAIGLVFLVLLDRLTPAP